MRAYTLSLLSKLNTNGIPIVESEILVWANNRLAEGGKDVKVVSFQDKTIKTALPLLHLIDVIKPGVINWSLIIQTDKVSHSTKLQQNILQFYNFRNVLTMQNIVLQLQEK